MGRKQLPLPGEIVKKSNALARARWSAESIWEPRLVALLASKVRADDTDFQVYEVPIAELIGKADKNSSGRTYLDLANVVDKVMSRVLTIKDDKGKGWIKYNVFSRCRYRPEDGTLELGFHPDLRPHYLNLQAQFAQFNLMEYLMLPSVYSQRIFEILKSWSNCPEAIISLAELHDMLDTPESLRPDFAQFRRRVLEKAYKDIHDKTIFSFEWEPIKQGRTVTAIRFIFAGGKKALVQRTKQEADKKKGKDKNNKNFVAAVACAKKKNGICTLQDNKKMVCKLCIDLAIVKFSG